MKYYLKTAVLSFLSLAFVGGAFAQEEEVFEYQAGFNLLTGQEANIGGFIFPKLFVIGTGGVFEPGSSAEDFATTEHDPQNDIGIQQIELSLGINLDDRVTGEVTGIAFMGEEEVWETELEEAYLHVHIDDDISIGGGQFLNRFGFQTDKHLHDWDFVNQNLVNSRILNEGEFITQGGEIILKSPDRKGIITIGGGGVRTHAHGHEDEHGHGDEDHDDDHDDDHGDDDHDDDHEEEHHLEADSAYFSDWVVTADFRRRFDFDDSMTFSASLAFGRNDFGRHTSAYGAGFQKVWNGHDHGNGPDFCTGATMLRSEIIGRTVEVFDEEDGERFDAKDFGISNALYYGLTDATTVSIRHDWVSDMEAFELEARHRFSTALSTYLDPAQRIRARIQYDYNDGDSLESEHAAFFQLQYQWGGQGGGHHNHDH